MKANLTNVTPDKVRDVRVLVTIEGNDYVLKPDILKINPIQARNDELGIFKSLVDAGYILEESK